MKLLRPQRHKKGHSSNSPSYAETCSNKLEAVRKQLNCPEMPDTAYATKAAKHTCNNINKFTHSMCSRKEAFHSQGSITVSVDTALSSTPEARFGIVADFIMFIARLLQKLGCRSVHVSSGFICWHWMASRFVPSSKRCLCFYLQQAHC